MQTTTYRDYWSTKWPFYNETLPSIMSGRRFELLLSNLHLNDDEKMPPRGSPHFDRLYKVRPVLDRVVEAFKVHYKPQKTYLLMSQWWGSRGDWLGYNICQKNLGNGELRYGLLLMQQMAMYQI